MTGHDPGDEDRDHLDPADTMTVAAELTTRASDALALRPIGWRIPEAWLRLPVELAAEYPAARAARCPMHRGSPCAYCGVRS